MKHKIRSLLSNKKFLYSGTGEELNSQSQLGGNLGWTNIDIKLLYFFVDKLRFISLLDIGCGPGGMVFHARDMGMIAYGIEGDPNSIPPDCPLIKEVDYRNGCSRFESSFDIGISIEFLEHVPKEFTDNYMRDFCKCKNVLVTAAPPEWGGIGHVNEQLEEYWITVFNKYGFEYNSGMTNRCREVSEITFKGEIRAPRKQFVQNRGLFFNRKY